MAVTNVCFLNHTFANNLKEIAEKTNIRQFLFMPQARKYY